VGNKERKVVGREERKKRRGFRYENENERKSEIES